MEISKKEYAELVKKVSKPTKSYKTLPAAFFVGGFICALGEVLRLIFIHFNFDKTSASSWVSIILILATAILTGIGFFDNIAKFSGAGSFVPITGFANAVVAPAIEFKTEGFILGLASKMFIIAGPVIVYGTIASVIFGLVYYILKILGVVA